MGEQACDCHLAIDYQGQVLARKQSSCNQIVIEIVALRTAEAWSLSSKVWFMDASAVIGTAGHHQGHRHHALTAKPLTDARWE